MTDPATDAHAPAAASPTLVEFILARLDEDERVALAATPSPWRIDPRHPNVILEPFPIDSVGMAGDRQRNLFTGQISNRRGQSVSDARHIARHDPARVLAEVAAKRRMVDQTFRYEAKIDGEWGCVHTAEEIAAGRCTETPVDQIKTLRLLALPFADHPEYREEWKP